MRHSLSISHIPYKMLNSFHLNKILKQQKPSIKIYRILRLMKCTVGIFLFEYGIEHTKNIKSAKCMLSSLFSKEKHIASSILLVHKIFPFNYLQISKHWFDLFQNGGLHIAEEFNETGNTLLPSSLRGS